MAKSLKTVKASGTTLPEAYPPEMINPYDATKVSVHLGNSVVLAVGDPENWSAHILEPGILEFIPGGNQGTYTTNPALKALAVGTSVVHLVNASDISKVYEVEITVTG